MIWQFILAMSIPSAITGFIVWRLKKYISANEAKQLKREEEQQQLMFLIIQSERANQIGIEAIAKAIQRIPDAHCNGDMTAALATIDDYKEKEDNFITKLSIQQIFDQM